MSAALEARPLRWLVALVLLVVGRTAERPRTTLPTGPDRRSEPSWTAADRSRPIPTAGRDRATRQASVQHPSWCDVDDSCEVFWEHDRTTVAFHTVRLLDEEPPAGKRRGLVVELVQAWNFAPDGTLQTVDTAVHADLQDGRVDCHQVAAVAAAFARAAELIGYDVSSDSGKRL